MSFAASRVAKHLWVGSAPNTGEIPASFDMVVLAAKEYQPRRAFANVVVVHVPLDDSGLPMTIDEIQAAPIAARIVAKALIDGQRVLVTCAQGRNRSGLIAALALKELGVEPQKAANMVRAARGSDALSNPYFVDFLGALR